MMSRKDFEAIAAVLADTETDFAYGDGTAEWARDDIAERLADHFATVNPNFDRNRFLTASDAL